MKSFEFIGKIGFGLAVIYFGVNHFMNASRMISHVPAYFPLPEVIVYLTGAAMMAAGISLIIGKKAQLAMLLLGMMFLLFAVIIDLPKGEAGMFSLMKNVALASASWFMCAHSKD